VLHCQNRLSLLERASGTALTGSLVLGAAGFHLVGEHFSTGLLSLRLVDILHQHTLVLEDVTLRLLVQGMVEVLVNLASLSILS